MEFKAKDIAVLLNGVVEGNPEVTVNNVSKIEEGKPHTLAFLANPKYEHFIYDRSVCRFSQPGFYTGKACILYIDSGGFGL